MGRVWLLLSGVLAALVVGATVGVPQYRAWRSAQLAHDALMRAQRQMQDLAAAVMQYTADHKEHLPPADTWLTDLQAYNVRISERALASSDDRRLRVCYNREVAGRTLAAISDPTRTFLFFQSCRPDSHGCAMPESVPSSTPTGLFAVTFVDGHGYPRGVSGRADLIQQSKISVQVGDLDTRLARAVTDLDVRAVRELLRQGAQANSWDEEDTPVLAVAVREMDHDTADDVLKVCEALLKAHGNPDATDSGGATPLMIAADGMLSERTDLMKMLLSAGARVNAADSRGMTALMYAAASGNVAGVRFLLHHGADPSIRNKAGQSALDLARKSDSEPESSIIAGMLDQSAPGRKPAPSH